MQTTIQTGIALLCLAMTFPAWLNSPFEFLSSIKNHFSLLHELAYRGASPSYYVGHRTSLHDNEMASLLSGGWIFALSGLVGAAFRRIPHAVRHLAWLALKLSSLGTLFVEYHPADHGRPGLPVHQWSQTDSRFLAAAALGLVGLVSSVSAHAHSRSRSRDELCDEDF